MGSMRRQTPYIHAVLVLVFFMDVEGSIIRKNDETTSDYYSMLPFVDHFLRQDDESWNAADVAVDCNVAANTSTTVWLDHENNTSCHKDSALHEATFKSTQFNWRRSFVSFSSQDDTKKVQSAEGLGVTVSPKTKKTKTLRIGVPLNKGFNAFVKVNEDDYGYTNEYKVQSAEGLGVTVSPKTKKTKTLRIGVPLNKGFNAFVKVNEDDYGYTNEYKVIKGFSIEVFYAVLEALPFKVQPIFLPFSISKYEESGASNTIDDLLKEITSKSYDIVVGDITILANRAKYVDFTPPYLASQVFVIVPVKHDKCRSMWMFIKPFSLELWFTVGIANIFVGLVLVFLERRRLTNNELEYESPLARQFCVLFWLPLSALVFQEWKLTNKWSKVVLFMWLCVAYVIMQSYTANLSLMLTTYQNRPAATSSNEFCYVGYQEGSFVKELLINEFNFTESQLKPYSTIEEYHMALSKGSRNGGVDAIYDELPYANLFMRKYNSQYTTLGPVYNTVGFGFAFRLGSRVVQHFSRALLNVTESSKMCDLKKKYFGVRYTSQNDNQQGSSNPSLDAYSFLGLFMVAAAATLVVMICSECSTNERPPSTNNSIEMINTSVDGESSIGDEQQLSPTSSFSTEELSVGAPDEE